MSSLQQGKGLVIFMAKELSCYYYPIMLSASSRCFHFIFLLWCFHFLTVKQRPLFGVGLSSNIYVAYMHCSCLATAMKLSGNLDFVGMRVLMLNDGC